MPNVWRLIAHHDDTETAVRWMRREARVAIGWGTAGDMRQHMSPEKAKQKILEEWPTSHNAGVGGKQLWEFLHSMSIRDYIIVSDGKSRVLTTQVTGEYEFSGPADVPVYGGDYRHQRKVEILPVDPNDVWRLAGAASAPGYGVRWTLIKCVRPVEEAAIKRLYRSV
jgi:predicted Mrr-cat superfamily restriction endonuclease